jgi:hypothetical protein
MILAWQKEPAMLRRVSTLLALTFLVILGFAKDKTKNVLPAYVLQAKTVAIIIDPNAGMSIDDPQANQRAQKDVEAALLKWGRFDLVSETKSADLIIVVRKGNGRPMDDPMSDARQQNNGGDVINSSGRGGSMGPPRGSLPPSTADPQSQGRIGLAEDSFAVFKGGENPLDASPAWKYMGTEGLSPQTVPAVAAFRKAVAAAEKAAAEKP